MEPCYGDLLLWPPKTLRDSAGKTPKYAVRLTEKIYGYPPDTLWVPSKQAVHFSKSTAGTTRNMLRVPPKHAAGRTLQTCCAHPRNKLLVVLQAVCGHPQHITGISKIVVGSPKTCPVYQKREKNRKNAFNDQKINIFRPHQQLTPSSPPPPRSEGPGGCQLMSGPQRVSGVAEKSFWGFPPRISGAFSGYGS